MQDHAGMSVPLFGARSFAKQLLLDIDELKQERDGLKAQMDRLGGLTVVDLEGRRDALIRELEARRSEFQAECESKERSLQSDLESASAALASARERLAVAESAIVKTEELAVLQEAGIYKYRHPLSDAVQYESALANVDDQIKTMTKKDGGAVLATTNWTVNGSEVQGRKMVNDFSKLMLRAFNAEADNLVRGLKPFKLASAVERLTKVSDTIEKLGKTMSIRISEPYFKLRVRELELTADFLQKESEEKEIERLERERLREERKVQAEIERERMKLEKERQHYANALAALEARGDTEGAARVELQMADVNRAIQDVDYRSANIRAGYVYVISNIGSFGEEMVKVGMTRRLDPMDRIRELSDASVPFNFDIHALFFSKDAVGIETAMHDRLSDHRVNTVNMRREFFRISASHVKAHLVELAGELLQFQEIPEALEYRQCLGAKAH